MGSTRDSNGGTDGEDEQQVRRSQSKRPGRMATVAYSSHRADSVLPRENASSVTTARPPMPQPETESEDRPTQPLPTPALRPHWFDDVADGWSDDLAFGASESRTTERRPKDWAKDSDRPTVAPPPQAQVPQPAARTARDAIEAVSRSRPSAEVDPLDEMQELFALDDWSGALKVAEFLLGRDGSHERARLCAEQCRERLCAQYVSKLGALTSLVSVALNDAEVRWLGLDHRAGFLLSRIDGRSSLEELLDICGMPRLEALKTLVDLQARGVIAIRLQRDPRL